MSRPLSRRQLLQRAGLLGAAGVSLPSMLASTAGAARQPQGQRAMRRSPRSSNGGQLHFDNWPAYIDPTEDDLVGTVDRFHDATGIDVTYTEGYNDNEEYFALIQPLLGRGNAIDPDIIAPSDNFVGRLAGLGWLEELPLDDIPNAANLRDDLVNPPWDPEGRFSLPWQTGITGVAYNIDVTGRELSSTNDLFDPEFRGKVAMLTDMQDTMGLILLSVGVDITNLSSFDEAAEAFEKLEQAKDDGQIRAFTGNDYMEGLDTGNFAAAIGWSGDIAQLALDNPSVRFVVPDEGGVSWSDSMVIPKGAENIAEAAQWMNFVYDPVEAAQITAWVQFNSPVKGVQEEVAELDPELAEDTLVFPDDEMLSRIHEFAQLDDDTEAEFEAAFAAIIGA